MINLNLFYLPIMDFEDIYNIHHYQDNEVNEVITSLLEDEELTDEERFDLYYEEHRRVQEEKNSMSYDELLRKLFLSFLYSSNLRE